MDQSGFIYEIISKRTLDIQSSKAVNAAVINKNKTMHSYTSQMTINATEKSVGPLFLALLESKGQFGPFIMQKLPKTSTPNLFIKLSRSQKN